MHEMIMIIPIVLFALGAWGMTYFCLRAKGSNLFTPSGYLTLPKDERAKYKAKYDVIAMNRYSGKMVYLPLALLLTAMIPLPVYHATWYGIIVGMGGVVVLGMYFVAVPKLVGNYFEIK